MGRKISLRARCVTLLAVTLTVNKEVEVTTHEDKHASPAFRETGQEGVSFFRVVFTRHDIQHSSIQYGAWTAIQTEQESLGELRFKEDIYIYIYIYTGCHRRNGPNFGRVFLMLNYTDITQNTYIQS